MTGLTSVLLTLVPSLTALAEPTLPAVVLALVVAALCWQGTSVRLAHGHLAVLAPRTSYDDRSRARGRVTDTVHHPLRPRAPGLA
ncbi:hypothetical protein GCM10009737_25760 [Nocardioides lentus]|uniref:Uncharacterized protein n=1 Tax=Nocardioides lentus TaxID=338077 RepID=A0ABP5AXV3_9ACTN